MATETRIRAELETPPVVHLPTDEQEGTVRVDVLCRLHNDGVEDYVVAAATHEEIHNWYLLDARHREIARQPAGEADPAAHPEGAHPISSQAIMAGHSHNATQRLTIPARKLRAGGRYRIRYTFWGQLAEADFVVLPPLEEMTGSRPSTPARRKKAARKRSAKKKTTAKKKAAAKKKTTARKKAAANKKAPAKKKAARKKAAARRRGDGGGKA